MTDKSDGNQAMRMYRVKATRVYLNEKQPMQNREQALQGTDTINIRETETIYLTLMH